MRGEVAAEIGHDPFTEAGPWRLRTEITRRKNGAFVATADLADGTGATSDTMGIMVAPDCRTLVVKMIALWASWVLTDPPPAAPQPLPSPPPPPPVLPSAAAPPALRLRLGAATGIELGVGPTPTPLFSLNLALQSTTVPIVSLEVEVRTDLPLPATGDGGARIHALVMTGSFLTCFHAFDGGLVSFCPMFTAGRVSGGGRYSATDASGIYSAAGGRVGAAIPFASRRFAFTLAGDVLGTLHPFQLRLEERPVWRTGGLAGAIQAGFSSFF
jgi:hypothetical protein